MYITVELIDDKFNKACKTATAFANYCGSITAILYSTKFSGVTGGERAMGGDLGAAF